MDNASLPERKELLEQLLEPQVLRSLSQAQLWKTIKALSDERKIRYARRRQRKYGNLNKGFSPSELSLFFKASMHPKARLAFLLMAGLGLRIGEVVMIRREHLDLQQRRLYLRTEKAGTNDSLFLHDGVYEHLVTWIQAHDQEIAAHDNYLLFAGAGKNPHQYASPNWLRNEFRLVCEKAGLNLVYATTDERVRPRERSLHRFTTHSLRHTFATRFYRHTKDLILTSKALRHSDTKSTITYIYADQHDLDGRMQELALDF